MSKYLEKKKESIIRVNRIIDSLESEQDVRDVLENYKFKHEKLKKQYEQLNKVFEFHKGIIQNISSCIVTMDMQGKITFMNKSALDLTGFTAEKMPDDDFVSLFSDKEEGTRIVNQLLHEKVMFESKETNLISKKGRIVPVGFSTAQLKENGSEEKGIIFIFRDISDLINFRNQMERMDRLATLGELSAGIAHEIRNPLAGIKTSAQVLEESFSPGDFRAQLVSRIVKEIDRSNRLLQRFFNFAKPSRPKPGFHSLQNILEGIQILLEPRLSRKKIKFFAEYEENLPDIYIDEGQFEQVMLNLILNAFDAMPNGGNLNIKAFYDVQKIVYEGQREPGAIAIYIEDTGKGILPDKIEKIFNPFYTTKSDGVGLGLSISTRLLEENQSKIEVESVPDSGTTFKVYLPFVKDKHQE